MSGGPEDLVLRLLLKVFDVKLMTGVTVLTEGFRNDDNRVKSSI